jgi:RNA polymerase sigma factor (sigma-70 family)
MGLRTGSILTLVRPSSNAQACDAELLGRFREDRDEIAFAELVRRHGSMVFGVCRRLLPHWHDAEDAFQATFLVLACKPSAVSPPERIGAWLHGVACRIAQRVRRTESRRLNHETMAAIGRQTETCEPLSDDVRESIDAVLLGLPQRYRAAIVLCDLEGLTRKCAAERLGWSEGLLSGRLARARKLLADRLTRRGVTLGVGGIGTVLAIISIPNAMASELVRTTLSLIKLVRGGLDTLPSGPVASLATGITQSMFRTRVCLFTGILSIGLVLGVGATLLAASRTDSGIGQPTPFSHTATPAVRLVSLPNRLIRTQKPAPAWKELVTIEHPATVTAIASGEGNTLFAGDEDMNVFAWNARSGGKIKTILKNKGATEILPIDELSLHPDGEWLYIIHAARQHVVEMNLSKNNGNGRGGTTFLGFTGDGRAYILADPTDATKVDFLIHHFPRIEGAVPDSLKHKAEVTKVAVCDRAILATMTTDSTLSVWDIAKNKLLWSVPVEKLELTALGISPTADQISVAGKDGVVRLFDGVSGKLLHQLKGHVGEVHAVSYCGKKEKYLVTAGADKTVRVWNPDTGKEIAVLKGHTGAVRCVLISPDGEYIISGSADKTIKVWELKP